MEVLSANTRGIVSRGLQDLYDGLNRWSLWTRLGAFDVRRRYVRTTFGPLWTTLSLGIFATVLSIFYAQIWKLPLHTFFPYFVAGFISWTLLVTFVLESCSMFFSVEAILRNIPLPLTVIVCTVIVRNLIVFFHHLVVYIVVALFFSVPLFPSAILIIPALCLFAINALSIGLILGIVCVRYRDVIQVVTVVTNLLFFITPVIWMPHQVGEYARFYMVDLNPIYHFIEILRGPLLGSAGNPMSWLVVGTFGVLNSVLAIWFLGRYRDRVMYWL